MKRLKRANEGGEGCGMDGWQIAEEMREGKGIGRGLEGKPCLVVSERQTIFFFLSGPAEHV